MIKVEIVADSANSFGDRLTSLVLTYPRIIHSEMMTHRMFSRNASSSRAVPVDKMIKAVRENTFCPFEFQKSHKGMQGSEYFTGADRQECINLWLESAELALQQAEKMKAKCISKQIINRILEPYQYYTVLITGSKEGWQNFFNLRCPSYKLIGLDEENVKSRKEWLEKIQFSSALHPSMYPKTDVEWLQINKGQAEIHIMDLAEKIYDSMNESKPKQLKAGEWHIPFEDKIHIDGIQGITAILKDGSKQYQEAKWITEAKVKISTAMAAHTSYTVVGGEAVKSYEKWIEIHDKLMSYDPPHSSPLEHCARAMSDEEYYHSVKGFRLNNTSLDTPKWEESDFGWCNNLKGFIPYRYFIDNNLI